MDTFSSDINIHVKRSQSDTIQTLAVDRSLNSINPSIRHTMVYTHGMCLFNMTSF